LFKLLKSISRTDTGTNSIAMSDLEGNLITTVIQDDMQEPRAIALHPEKG
jgi:hypothetical protein